MSALYRIGERTPAGRITAIDDTSDPIYYTLTRPETGTWGDETDYTEPHLEHLIACANCARPTCTDCVHVARISAR